MKKTRLAVLCSVTCSLAFSQNFTGASPVSVAPGYGNYHPQLEVTGDNELGVIWTDASTNILFFSKRTGSETFSTPLQINPTNTEVQDYTWSGPDLTVWQNNVYVIYRDFGFETGHVYLVKSADNGLTFSDTVRVDNLIGSYPQFPDVAVYNDTVFATYMVIGTSTPDPQYYLSRSVDGGLSFEAGIDITTWLGGEACDCCPPEIIADENRVIVFYRQNATNIRDIKAVVSYDRGETFSSFFSPDDHNWYITSCPSTGPDARFLENGNPVCIYKTTVSGDAKLFVNEYDLLTDTEVNLVDVYAASASNSGINYPQIDVDGSLIGVVWEGLGTSTDIFFNGSNTGVNNISPVNAINLTDVTSPQSKPDIAILNGSFHVVYSDLIGTEVKYIRVSSVSNLEENKNELVTVYPNPSSNVIHIDIENSEADMRFELLDVSGRIVQVFQTVNEFSFMFDMTSFTNGVYYLKAVSENRTEIVTLVKN